VFLARQSAPDAFPGLPFVVGLLVGLVALIVFGIMAESYQRSRVLKQVDNRLALGMEEHETGEPAVGNVFGIITQAGSIPAMIVLSLGIGLVLIVRGHRRLAVAAMLTALGGGLMLLVLKRGFDRERPGNPDRKWVTEENESFPSGHSMGSVIGYGLLAYLLVLPRVQQRRRTRAAIIVGLIALLLLIGFSRIYLRAHYFSDVVAGFAVGTVWLALFIVIHETVHRRQRRRQAFQSARGPEA
jgi:undecaprenyl-diphosphatase